MNIEQLADLIETSADLTALIPKPDQLLTALTDKNIQQTDSTEYTNKTIANRFPYNQAAAIITAFDTASQAAATSGNSFLKSFFITLSSSGIDFSNPLTQQLIDQLTTGGAWDAATGTALKEMGVWYISLATQRLGADPIAGDVTAALTIIARRALQRQMSASWNNVSAAILAGTVTTKEDAVTLFGA